MRNLKNILILEARMKKRNLERIKFIFRLLFMFSFAFVLIKIGAFYGEYKEPGEGFIEFFSVEREFSYNKFTGVPESLTTIIGVYQNIISWIWLCVGFSSMVMFVDYFIDPENHFVTVIKNRINKIKLEDGLNGK